MSVSKWAYIPEKCDGDYCCGDCDHCNKVLLCDSCGYEGDDCPWPQENHCEKYQPKYKMPGYDEVMDALDRLKVEYK